MKVIISAGGTGGHIYPALAIVEKLKEKEKNLEIIYIGTHNRMESEIIPQKGIKYIPLEIYGLSKTNMLRNLKNLSLISKANKKCLEIMKEFKPDIVIGTGGYVTFPVIKAAKKLKIKTFIHEQNSIPGKSNKMICTGVDLVGVSFKNSEFYFKGAKHVFYSGNPCASNALKVPAIPKKSLGLSENKKLVVIVAGSLGSSSLNEKFKSFLKLIEKEKFEVLYITGKSHYDEFMLDFKVPKNVVVKPYLDNLAGILKESDLVISRAGASTISEILALKIPSILIPSPYVANNHQYYNALDLANRKVAILLEEKKFTAEKLLISVFDILENEKTNRQIKEKLNSCKEVSASEIIYTKIKGVIK